MVNRELIEVLAVGDPLPSPPEGEMLPEMRAWADAVKKRHADLAAAYAKVRDALARASGSDDEPDDFVPLKVALSYTPHVHPEFARRLSASGEVVTRQSGKGGRRFVSLSSFMNAVRRHFG